jgi:hypothetical protein
VGRFQRGIQTAHITQVFLFAHGFFADAQQKNQTIFLLPITLCLLLTPAAAQTTTSNDHAGEQAIDAPRPSTAVGPNEGAETVFTKQAAKVVFLITRKSGEPHSLASGVILAADGYIAANYHALEGADAVEIRFFSEPENSEDYTAFKAVKLLYADSDHDIAILVAGIAAPPRRVLYCCHEASPVGHPADRAPGRPGAHRATRHRVHLG